MTAAFKWKITDVEAEKQEMIARRKKREESERQKILSVGSVGKRRNNHNRAMQARSSEGAEFEPSLAELYEKPQRYSDEYMLEVLAELKKELQKNGKELTTNAFTHAKVCLEDDRIVPSYATYTARYKCTWATVLEGIKLYENGTSVEGVLEYFKEHQKEIPH